MMMKKAAIYLNKMINNKFNNSILKREEESLKLKILN
jgi:hypothetical protein